MPKPCSANKAFSTVKASVEVRLSGDCWPPPHQEDFDFTLCNVALPNAIEAAVQDGNSAALRLSSLSLLFVVFSRALFPSLLSLLLSLSLSLFSLALSLALSRSLSLSLQPLFFSSLLFLLAFASVRSPRSCWQWLLCFCIWDAEMWLLMSPVCSVWDWEVEHRSAYPTHPSAPHCQARRSPEHSQGVRPLQNVAALAGQQGRRRGGAFGSPKDHTWPLSQRNAFWAAGGNWGRWPQELEKFSKKYGYLKTRRRARRSKFARARHSSVIVFVQSPWFNMPRRRPSKPALPRSISLCSEPCYRIILLINHPRTELESVRWKMESTHRKPNSEAKALKALKPLWNFRTAARRK